MPATTQKTYLQSVSVKSDTGELGDEVPIGAKFADVVDGRSAQGNYTLEQFFDNYMAFMKNADFIYYGGDNPEKNTHIKVWIDNTTPQNVSK